MTTDNLKDKLKQKSGILANNNQRLKEQSERINKVLYNLELYHSTTHKEQALRDNNERYGVSRYVGADFLGTEHGYQVMMYFAHEDEPLAKKIVMEFNNGIMGKFDELALLCSTSPIPKGLLERTIDRETYQAYFNGDLPIGKLGGEDYFLPKGDPEAKLPIMREVIEFRYH